MSTYTPQQFDFSTTNGRTYKDFRFANASSPEKVKMIKPEVNPVQTKSLPGHFKTMNQREMKKHQVEKQLVDRIPYP